MIRFAAFGLVAVVAAWCAGTLHGEVFSRRRGLPVPTRAELTDLQRAGHVFAGLALAAYLLALVLQALPLG